MLISLHSQASVQVMALINSLCAMLRTTPFHRESYSRLILTVIGQFYQRCSDRFYDLVAVRNNMQPDAAPRIVLGAQWAQKADLGACLSELLRIIDDDSQGAKKLRLCRQEAHLEEALLGEGEIVRQDLISSARNMASLASLYRSVVSNDFHYPARWHSCCPRLGSLTSWMR